jgi:Sulfatase/PA14 domain
MRWRAISGQARAVFTYLTVALTVTALAAIVSWAVAPQTGLVRTFYPKAAFAGPPLRQDRTEDLTLAFLYDAPELPRRFFSVRWSGFWFVPEEETVDLYTAGGDGRVELYVDRHLILTWDSSAGSDTVSQQINLAAGAHEVIVRYEQYGGAFALRVLQSRAGKNPAPFPPGQLFPKRPDVRDYRMVIGRLWLHRLVVAVWLVLPVLALLVRGVRRELRMWTRPTARTFGRELSRVALPALLGPVLLFLAGPHTIFAANRSEFDVAFADIAWPRLIAAAAVSWMLLLTLGAATCLLSDRVRRAYVALLVAFGMLLWVQATLMVADFGPLYGEGLDLSRFAWRAPLEAGIWVVGVWLALRFAEAVSRIAPLASGLFIVLQLAVIGTSMFAAPAPAPDPSESTWKGPPEQLYHLSGRQNVIHVVLDGFLSEVLDETIEQDRGAADRTLAGFVFFADHLGAFPTTRASMPAMLTGATYRNRVPFDQFLDATTHKRTIASVLAGHGYVIHSITFDDRDQPPIRGEQSGDVVRYKIPTPYGSRDDYVRFAALQLFDFSLFRHVPQGVKPLVYSNQAWFAQRHYLEGSLGSERARNVRPSNHVAFLEEFAARLTIGQDQPVYTFIHLAIPHPPVVVSADCSFIGQVPLDRASYTAQAKCGLLVVGHLLDRLRSLGVYDRSVILLTSDHGWPVPRSDRFPRGHSDSDRSMEPVILSAMPLLAVKPSGASGPVRVSYAHTAITDVATTILALLGLPSPFPGQPVLEIDPNAPRPRTFAYHSWVNADWGRPYYDVLNLYSVNGRVRDPAAWRFERRILPEGRDAGLEAGGSARTP